MTVQPFSNEGGKGDPAPDPSIQWLLDGLDEVVAANPKPLVALTADSDLKAGEAFYTPAELADGAFMYREALFYRLAAENMRDELERYRIADLRRTDPATAELVYGSTVDAGFELTPAGVAYLAEAGQ